jgi:class 3 adenylate cyclase
VPSTGGTGAWPLAVVAVNPGAADEREVPIHDVLVVGRETTVETSRQLLVDSPIVSRRHLEIRLDPGKDVAYVFDTSTNGTRVNGQRIERAKDVRLRPGDRITVGPVELEFRAERFGGLGTETTRNSTLKEVKRTRLVMVAGDILGYSTIAQYTDDDVLLTSVDTIYRRLCELLEEHGGVLNNYVGDAFFAIWNAAEEPDAARRAMSFAIAAVRLVGEIAPTLPLRTPGGDPIQMGWGLEMGPAAVGTFTGRHVVVLGDATNVAFRLSSLAARAGRAEILVTGRVEAELRDRFQFSSPEDVQVKGRSGTEQVFGVSAVGAQRAGW